MVIESLSHLVIGLLIGHFISLLQHPNLIEFGDTILIEFLFMCKAQSQLHKILHTIVHKGLCELTSFVANKACVQEIWRVKDNSTHFLTCHGDTIFDRIPFYVQDVIRTNYDHFTVAYIKGLLN